MFSDPSLVEDRTPCSPGMDSECKVIVSAITASSPSTPIKVRIYIQEDSTTPPFSRSALAFLDSGAMGNFIHPCLVAHYQIPTSPHPLPLSLQTVTGARFYQVMKQVHIQMHMTHGHHEVITLNIAPIGAHDVILGLPWIKYHGVQFNWKKGEITHWSPECEGHCYTSVASLDTECPNMEEHPVPDLSVELVEVYAVELGHAVSKKIRPKEQWYADLRKVVPPEYHDYLDVFDEEEAMSKCPDRCPGYDFEIHLRDGAKPPPPSRPYHLSHDKSHIMKEWLTGMEETGMIRHCTT